MKKNIAMRLASGLMLSCLLSTCVISGTFAKYTTSDDATDSARVAKWGVTVTTEGVLFGEQYKNEIVDAGDGTITVQVADAGGVEQNVVAPGTQNTDGMTFTLTGTPEVDVNVAVVITVNDIVLEADDYLDYTTGAADDTFVLADDYYPVKFTLTKGTTTVVDGGTLAEVKTELLNLNGNYDSNTDLAKINGNTDGTYKLTWAWAFETNDINNKADTYLANTAPRTVSFNIAITVTQID